MPLPRFRGLLSAASVLLLAACAGDAPSAIDPPDGISAATLNVVRLRLAGGGDQAGNPAQPLAQPLVVRVTDQRGNPVAGGTVNFITNDGNVEPRKASTDAEGYARGTWTLGPRVGAQALRVSGTGGTLVVRANAAKGSGSRVGILKILGDEQEGATGRQLPTPIRVLVVRDDGSLVAGATVRWQAAAVGSVQSATSRTSNRGVAQHFWTLGAQPGTQTLTASVDGAVSVAFTAQAKGPPAGRAATLLVQPDSVVLEVNATAALTAVIRDSAGAQIPGLAPAWSSSNPAVAAVDSQGVVRAVTGGTARVTATLGALTAHATVRVRAAAASIQLLPDSLVLEAGAMGQLSAVVRDASGAIIPSPALAWSTANAGVATVDASGKVSGVAAGTARVTATLGGLSAHATVRVRGGGPSLELFPDSLVLDIGVWGKLYPVARDASGRAFVGYNLQWSTSNDQVVFPFSDGSMLPVAAGTARITARLGDLSASVLVRVRPARGVLTIPQIQKRAGYADRIDLSTRSLELNWWIHVSQRGVSAVTMRIRGPLGRTIDCMNAAATHEYFRNEFSCSLLLPRGSEAGVWRVDRVTVTRDGQTTTFAGADLDAMGTLGRAFDVYGTGADTQPPLVRMMWPHQGTRYSDRYYMQFGVVDHVSGVRSARMTYRDPGGVMHTCEVSKSSGELAKVGGGVCLLPARPGSGTWNLVSVDVEDGAGNRATYTPQQIAELASGTSEAPFMVYSFTP